MELIVGVVQQDSALTRETSDNNAPRLGIEFLCITMAYCSPWVAVWWMGCRMGRVCWGGFEMGRRLQRTRRGEEEEGMRRRKIGIR